MSYAFKCEICDAEPIWRITRIGDVAVSWACATDLSVVCDRMQRDHEVTDLSVVHHAKLAEVAEINRMIRSGLGPVQSEGDQHA